MTTSMFALSTPNSPHFNEKNWIASREALAFSNRPATQKVAVALLAAPVVAAVYTAAVAKVAKLTETAIESAKVVNRETDRKVAEQLGLSMLSVKGLRAACKARGMVRYSKLKRADLLVMLA